MNVFISILFIAIGLVYIISPYTAWYLSHGWKFKDAEPSDLALGAARVGGVMIILFAIALLFAA